MKESVFTLEVTFYTLEYKIKVIKTSKSSIQRIRMKKWKQSSKTMKIDYQNDVPDKVIFQWDGKVLPVLDAREMREEHLVIVILYENREQLIIASNLDKTKCK